MLRTLTLILIFSAKLFAAELTSHSARLRDIASVEGVRQNPLVGYGLVVGLNGTGDRRQTLFTTQMLANILNQTGISALAQANQMQQRMLLRDWGTAVNWMRTLSPT